ncbi:unnamed protein product [Protopolystoma xenopodis]|uniref:Uncharacterized protein n=1 Tax=Protopolystoma xenopodis TaxID=117903 RepID=A0A3S5CJ80_9PLAT|nr:unnamed protein product [Protopolystoma xenopodis]
MIWQKGLAFFENSHLPCDPKGARGCVAEWLACQATVLHCRGSSPAESVDKTNATSKLQSTGAWMRRTFGNAKLGKNSNVSPTHIICGKILLLPVLHHLKRTWANTSYIKKKPGLQQATFIVFVPFSDEIHHMTAKAQQGFTSDTGPIRFL